MGQSFIVYGNKGQRVSQKLQQKIGNETVRIKRGEWKLFNMRALCQNIRQWRTKSLRLSRNRHKSILKEITHINFSKLTYLNLSFNNIESLENISKIKMPKLQQLHFGENQLTSIKQVRKLRLPKLRLLNFNNNLISQASETVQMFTALFVQQITIQFWDFNTLQCHDVKWLCKLMPFMVQKIMIHSQRRIMEHQFHESLKKRYPSAKINEY